MKKKVHLLAFTLAFSLILFPLILFSEDDSSKVSSDALAQKLVNQCINIKENDIVRVVGGVRDVELLEDVATHVRKLGAFPLVGLVSDRMNRKYFDEVPAKYDSQVSELELKLGNIVSGLISVSYNENPALLEDVPPERFTAIGKAFAPVNKLYLERNVQMVNLGNDLYPTKERAKRFNVPLEKLSEVFWNGVNIDYMELEERGKKIQKSLLSGKHLHLTNPNGTDLKFNIEGSDIYVSDGVISDSEVKKGGAACSVWLPAGEVYFVPVIGSAEGVVFVDRHYYQGKLITNLKLTFKKGKLVSMNADSGIEPLKARYEAAGEGKDEFAYIDIGMNPEVKILPGSQMVAWMADGMITVGFGNNTWAGGINDSDFGISNYIFGSTLKVDGKIIVDKGEIKF